MTMKRNLPTKISDVHFFDACSVSETLSLKHANDALAF